MGLFSFFKKAGKRITEKKPEEAAVVKTAEEKKIDAMKAEIQRLGIPVSGLGIEFSEAVTITGEAPTTADKEKIILALGNIEGVAVVDDQLKVTNPAPEATFHTVQSGDTLSKISKQVYGDAMKYNIIFEANKPMLEHPDKIYPGQVLRIPSL